ncbi:zinc finger CCCH domain-containing protein 61-like [Rutidosis leptorrhynchoides]|uniref:zinc finger CCCH domain-containing protein 61-like n=1 Tax=Rutidosis leptorrhynchoides TaxID=125765 RepID=UPI003A9A475F
MASTCLYLSNKKSIRDIDIPPRKLLNRRASAGSSTESYTPADTMYQNDSPRVLPEETLFKKFLPYNNPSADSDDEDDPYAADHFRIYEFKVRKCTRSRSHDWTDCPFAHPGEKARRRCPRRYNYLGTVCADFRRGNCSRGDLCEFAHGVFECWLHPSRYRTEACKDGKNCQRKICFFAHTQRQFRVVPPEQGSVPVRKYHSDSSHCCAHCRCHLDIHHTNSPTSTLNIDLDSLSPPASPPFSPARSGSVYSPISRFADRLVRGESFGMTHLGQSSSLHKESMNEMMMNNQSLNELMRSMEAMNVEDSEFSNMNSPWMDACYNGGGGQQLQFDNYSVVNPNPCGSDMGRVFTRGGGDSRQNVVYSGSTSTANGPDLGWVNDLLT